MREMLVLFAVAGAYLLLRGFPDGWPAAARAGVAVALLLAGLSVYAGRRWKSGPVVLGRRRGRWRDSLVFGLLLLVLEFGLVGFFLAAQGPLESAAAGVEEWLRPQAAKEREERRREQADAASGNWLWEGGGRRPLPLRTDFKPGNRPEVFMQPVGDSSALLASRIYLHAFALGDFDGGAWSGGGGGKRLAAGGNDGWLRLAETEAEGAVVCRIFAGSQPNGQNPAIGIQGLSAVRLPELIELSPGMWLVPGAGEAGYDYEALSVPRELDGLPADARVPEGVDARYLEVPDTVLGGRVRHLAGVVSGEGEMSPVERLRRIRNHLRTAYDYSLEMENPEGLHPLENFLFKEQRGHCEFFATAGALMARAAGIPARVCYGWSGGTYYESSNLFVFRAREAHAWAEVRLGEEGWVVLDPTPPQALAAAGRPELAEPEAEPPVLGETEVAEEPGPGALPWVLGGVAVVALPVGLMAVSRRRVAGSDSSETEPAPGGLGYVRMLVRACRRRGVRCFPGRTLRSMLEALEEMPDFGPQLLRYHYGVRYEGRAVDGKIERELARRIRVWDGAQ